MKKQPEKTKKTVVKKIKEKDISASVRAHEKLHLDKEVFDGTVCEATIHRVLVMLAANKRQGTASTKTRADVSGSGRKPWRQKGTGRARVGETRNPLWRHGGIVFGPHPRDYSYSLPKKVRNLALRSALNDKINNKSFVIAENLSIPSFKTKECLKLFRSLAVPEDKKVLIVLDEKNENLYKSCRNLRKVFLTDSKTVNVYDVLNCEQLLTTNETVKNLTKRLKNENHL